MDKNSNQYESIKQKLLKLQKLAEQGYKGEADAAKRVIERLCAQYGITLEEVLCVEQPKRYEFEVTGSGQLSYFKRSRNRIAVDLTPLRYAELSSLFEWHKTNFLKDLAAMQDTIVEAYVNKHNIFRTLRRIAAIMAMQSELGDNTYHKQLEAAK